MQTACVAMAEERALTAGEDCRHPQSLLGEAGVSDGVHAREPAVQDPVADVGLQPLSGEAEPQELLSGENCVLYEGELGETCVT